MKKLIFSLLFCLSAFCVSDVYADTQNVIDTTVVNGATLATETWSISKGSEFDSVTVSFDLDFDTMIEVYNNTGFDGTVSTSKTFGGDVSWSFDFIVNGAIKTLSGKTPFTTTFGDPNATDSTFIAGSVSTSNPTNASIEGQSITINASDFTAEELSMMDSMTASLVLKDISFDISVTGFPGKYLIGGDTGPINGKVVISHKELAKAAEDDPIIANPEPATLAVLALGLIGLPFARRFRSK